jgi:Glycosyl hydrolases family 31
MIAYGNIISLFTMTLCVCVGVGCCIRLRQAIMARYRLLPYWYTLFHTAATVGMPPMRPLWVHYPDDTTTYTMEDQVTFEKTQLHILSKQRVVINT